MYPIVQQVKIQDSRFKIQIKKAFNNVNCYITRRDNKVGGRRGKRCQSVGRWIEFKGVIGRRGRGDKGLGDGLSVRV